MFCKFCGTELAENSTLCANCGKDNQEQPAKKKKTWQVVIIIVAIVLSMTTLLSSLGLMLYYGINGSWPRIFRENDLFYKDSYTVSDKKLMKKLDDVVATMGDSKLDNELLQIFYWMQIVNLGGYGSYYGLDYSKPLDEQEFSKETGQSWQQYLLNAALETWQQYQILTLEAEKNNFQMPKDYQDYLDNLEEELTKAAAEYKYSSALEMLQADMGAGANVDSYREYLRLYYTANLYFSQLVEKLDATEEEMKAYMEANPGALTTAWNVEVTMNLGKLVDVRHILIEPESSDTESETYTEAEWEACREKAQKILDEYLAGEKTAEAFGKLAAEHSVDGNKDEGGLYTDISKGIMVKEFEDWCFDETRKEGDTGLVKTKFGYHIMYYVGSEEAWLRYGREGVVTEKSNALLEELTGSKEMEVDYKAIALGFVDLSTN